MKAPLINYDYTEIPDSLSEGSLSSYFIEDSARSIGLTVRRFSETIVSCEDAEGKIFFFRRGNGQGVSGVASSICNNKGITQQVLEMAGIPTTNGKKVSSVSEASSYLIKEGSPVVLKPLASSKGRGVVCNIKNSKELEAAWQSLNSRQSSALIERHFEGLNLRVFVVGGRVVATTLRTRPDVVGDGVSTIDKLISIKNELRAKNPHLKTRLISQRASSRFLRKAGNFSLSSVPEEGARVILDYRANVSRGGDSIDITDDVHKSYEELAISAVNAVPGLEQAGVDLMVKDYRSPLSPDNCVVGEIESMPALTAHLPSQGNGRNVALMIINHYFQKRT